MIHGPMVWSSVTAGWVIESTDVTEKSLTGRVALITGAARGIGAAIARALAVCGARVAVCDLDDAGANAVAASINEGCSSAAAIPVSADVTSESSVSALIRQVTQKAGSPDILVNNAGVLFGTPFADISLAEWNAVIATNLTGSFLCARSVLPGMRARKRGRIVNIASSAGRSVSTLGGAHYTAAKAGVLGLTRAIAKEVAADGVLVNAVCPGLIDTEMCRSHCTAERLRAYERGFPIPRLGTVEEVAEVVQFLCSGASYVTGASLDVNGGDLMI